MILDTETLVDLCTTTHRAGETNLAVAQACAQISSAIHAGLEPPDGLWHTLVETLALNQGLIERVEELLLALIEANKREVKHGTA